MRCLENGTVSKARKMSEHPTHEIRMAVEVVTQPDGTFRVSNEIGLRSEEVGSIDDVLEVVDTWAKTRRAMPDGAGAQIVVDFNHSTPSIH